MACALETRWRRPNSDAAHIARSELRRARAFAATRRPGRHQNLIQAPEAATHPRVVAAAFLLQRTTHCREPGPVRTGATVGRRWPGLECIAMSYPYSRPRRMRRDEFSRR